MSVRSTSAEQATVVVVPRERFSHATASLESLYETIPPGTRVVYVDGGSPRRVARSLRKSSRRRGFELLRTEFYLAPQQARNLALPLVKTPFVVVVDNDVIFTPGWLDALLACAEETGASAVAPLYLEGPLEEERIHMAGGDCWTVSRNGRLVFHEEHTLMDRHLPGVRGRLERRPTELLEGHVLCIRTEVLEKTGPFDEGLLSADDHTDISLMINASGGTIWLEPASVISYLPPPPFSWSDLPFYMLRWSDRWNHESFAHFSRKWGVCFEDWHEAWYLGHRRIFLRRVRAALERLLGSKRGGRVYSKPVCFLERWLNRLVVWWTWDRSSRAREALLRASPYSKWKRLDRSAVEAYALTKFAPKPEGFRPGDTGRRDVVRFPFHEEGFLEVYWMRDANGVGPRVMLDLYGEQVFKFDCLGPGAGHFHLGVIAPDGGFADRLQVPESGREEQIERAVFELRHNLDFYLRRHPDERVRGARVDAAMLREATECMRSKMRDDLEKVRQFQ